MGQRKQEDFFEEIKKVVIVIAIIVIGIYLLICNILTS